MQPYFKVPPIKVAKPFIGAGLLQVNGGGRGGSVGQPDTVFRTKRGVEKTLFQLTIVLVTLFIIISIVALRIS